MKKILPLILMSVFIPGGVITATIRTVSNFPANVAQFNDIQPAINASSSGDTVYVHGSPNPYAGFTINGKTLTIIGPGYSPNKQLPFTAVVPASTIGIGSSGTEIHGIDFSGILNIATAGGIDNIRIIRNHFRCGTGVSFNCCTSGTYTGYIFEGNWFDNSQIRTDNPPATSLVNFIIQNNVFIEAASCLGGNLSGFTNASNVLIDHNLFYGNGSGPRDVFAGNSRFMMITNNIFVRRDAAAQNSFSTFNNNITFNTGSDLPWTLNSNSDGGGNVSAQSPQMASQASVDAGTNNPLLDFTISAGPANNSGSDGKDMGLLYDPTGSLNWTNTRSSRIPFIFSMNITTPTVAPGGNVSVTVESRRSN